jgi:hypothetical protein
MFEHLRGVVEIDRMDGLHGAFIAHRHLEHVHPGLIEAAIGDIILRNRNVGA